MKIVTILQTYKRPNYFLEQYNSIKNQTIKSDKIIVVENNGGCEFNYPDDIEVIKSSVNRKYHLRFAIGLLEDCDYLFFYDDDTISGSRFYETAINLINKENCLVVGNGRIIHLEKRTWDCPGWGNPSEKEQEVDFGGHCWVCKAEHLKYMWFEKPKLYTNCEDMQFSFNCFRFGKIKTLVSPHPIDNKEIWSSLKGTIYGSDKVASWICNKTHFQDRWNIIDEYIKDGYIPLIKR
jgi:hypothetical protein